MMSSKRTWVVLLAVFAMVLSACGGNGDTADPGEGGTAPDGTAAADLSGVEIVFSTHLAEEERAAVQGVIDDFQEQTGASVEITGIATEDLPDRLQVDVEGGNTSIHLFAVDNLALGTLVERELVQDIDDVQIPDAVFEAMVPDAFDGQNFFLPYRPNVQLTYVNRERLQEAGHEEFPKDLESIRQVAEDLRDLDGQGKLTIQLAEGGPAGVAVTEWLEMHGGNPLILNDEGSVQAFETLKEWWDDGLFAREALTAKFDTQIDYLVGEVAYVARNWPFTSDTLNEQGLLDRFDIYAGWEGPSGEANVIGGEVLGIPAGVEGDEREAAIALAEHLMSQSAQERLVAENAWPSIRDDALGEVPDHLQATFEAIQESLDAGVYRPNVPYWDAAQDAMNEAVRRILEQGEDVQSTLDDLNADIEAAAERADAEYPPSE